MEFRFIDHIPDFEDYLVSDDGIVFSNKTGSLKEMKLNKNVSGYLTVSLHSSHKKTDKNKRGIVTCHVHRLVAMTWIPNPKNKQMVNHKDGNKQNNHVSNLEWVTSSENTVHAYDILKNKRYSKPVVQTTLEGDFIAKYESLKKAQDETNVSSKAICLVCQGKRRKAGEFCWFYESEYKKGAKMRKLSRCKKVEQYSTKGEYIKTFESVKDAAEEVGALSSNISDACKGRLKTSKGFNWKFVEEGKQKEREESEDRVVLKNYPHDKISKDGRVYSTWLKRLKSQNDRRGYKSVSMTDFKGKNTRVRVHRLVAMAYLPNPNNYPMVNHIDGNPSNNNVENLEWCTASYNAQHAHDTGLTTSKKPVEQLNLDGNLIATFESMREASDKTKTHKDAISHVCCGKAKTAGGYKWRHAV